MSPRKKEGAIYPEGLAISTLEKNMSKLVASGLRRAWLPSIRGPSGEDIRFPLGELGVELLSSRDVYHTAVVIIHGAS